MSDRIFIYSKDGKLLYRGSDDSGFVTGPEEIIIDQFRDCGDSYSLMRYKGRFNQGTSFTGLMAYDGFDNRTIELPKTELKELKLE